MPDESLDAITGSKRMIELGDHISKGLQDGLNTPTMGVTDMRNDPVDHPAHYTFYQGLEVIDLTEQMNFNKGNAVKYIARAGIKDPSKEIEDLQKAMWYCAREIERIRDRP